ncbi:hypothetical protein [Alkalicoccobacillus porphyridii]|uniref:Uncharacterized protein n=1 Tax=Alkalicoccobacillus porphyridii TaxID=2597270 RepID=A0A554A4E6_9BACI|nr:hypothetical protein [Alkalicoccobacillus porphyridii]TSB48545.1 hypothetical protein FN960_03045 [Alkalicoccobacillus porphyridii]
MKKKTMIFILSILLLVGGFFIVRSVTQTGVTALDDSFTREFLDEDVKVGDGFYLFESRNGKYDMVFPEDFHIVSPGYESSERFESLRLLFEDVMNGVNVTKNIQIDYRGRDQQRKSDYERDFERSLQAHSFEMQYQEYENNGYLIKHGSSYLTLNGNEVVATNPEEYNPNTYFAIISTSDYSQYILLRYRIICEEEHCNSNKEQEDNFFKELIEGIQFN